MNIRLHSVTRALWPAVLLLALATATSHAHDQSVHEAITTNAFLSSDGAGVFLSDNLRPESAPFDVSPVLHTRDSDYPPSEGRSPMDWLGRGSYMEDAEDPLWAGRHFLRSCDHFYTLLHSPMGLTDSSETGLLPNDITDSFTWGTTPGMAGPNLTGIFAGRNDHSWWSARYYQYYALIQPFRTNREAMLALSLYALGHVLHLNQDLSQPDHVRNDEHAFKHWIEEYGARKYLVFAGASNAQREQLFPHRPHGWAYWRGNGFRQLKDFWDRGKYTGQPEALEEDANGTAGEQLGLAEYSNGNFIGEDAKYAEYHPKPGDIHYFPFPKLQASTTFRDIKAGFQPRVRSVVFRDSTPGNRVYVDQIADGAKLTNHSVLTYHAIVGYRPLPGTTLYVATTIHDDNVLWTYHTNLIPKAIEYSAGILDYFFRGRLEVTAPTWDAASGKLRFQIKNKSGEPFQSGTFQLLYDDHDGNRIQIPPPSFTTTYTDALADEGTIDAYFAPTPTPATNYIVVYQGTIGLTGTQPSVDKDVAVAAQNFRTFGGAYWTLDEASGDRVDSVGGVHLYEGWPPFLAAPGLFGNGLLWEVPYFVPGPDLSVDNAPSLALGGAGFSLFGWFRINATDLWIGFQPYLDLYQPGYPYLEAMLLIGDSDNPLQAFYANENGWDTVNLASPSLGSWHFFHYFFDPALQQMGFSLDNGPIAHFGTALSFPATDSMSLDIGSASDGWFRTGSVQVDEIGVNPRRMLTPAEVTYLYNGGAGRTWPLNFGQQPAP